MSITRGSQKMVKMTLPYNMQEITEEMGIKARQELNEDQSSRDKCLEELRNLLKGVKGLRFQDEDAFLLQFLRARKFSVQKAFKLCKCYYNCRKDDLWGNIVLPTAIQMLSYDFFGVLPYRDPDGCVIFYFIAEKWEPDDVPPKEGAQAIMSILMNTAMSPVTQICGYKLIVNSSGFTYRKVFRCTRYLWLLLDSILNCFPGRYKSVHIINEEKAVYHLWEITKFLLSQKLRSRVHFHGQDMEDLHKYIPPSILPEECGGDLGPFHNTVTINELNKFENQFEEAKKYGYNIDI